MARRVVLPEGWGQAWLEAPPLAVADRNTCRAYTADGWRLCWIPPPGLRAGCDIERVGPVPPGLAARWPGVPDFWQAWTVSEATAKAAGIPILAWLGQHGLSAGPQAAGTAVHVDQHGDVVCAFALHPNVQDP